MKDVSGKLYDRIYWRVERYIERLAEGPIYWEAEDLVDEQTHKKVYWRVRRAFKL